MEPVVTIGIITRNRPAFLRQAVESAMAQDTEDPYEILIVDDASTDSEGLAYLRSLGDEKIRVVFRDTQGGEAAGRNTVVKEMRGEFSLWLDDDDCLSIDAIRSQLTALKSEPGADVIYANLMRTDEQLNPVSEYRYRSIPEQLRLHVLLFYSPFSNGGSLIRRSLFDRCGLYDETFLIAPDYDFWVRAALAGAAFVHNDRCLYMYRGHGGNQALDSESPLFHEMNCRVIRKLVEQVPLKALFPMYDWTGAPDTAFALAMTSIAASFARHNDYAGALEVLGRGESEVRSFELMAMKAFVLARAGQMGEACAMYEQASLGVSRALQQICQMAGLR